MGGSGLVQLMTCDLSSKLPLVEKQTPDASQPNRKQRKRQPVPVGSVGRKESYVVEARDITYLYNAATYLCTCPGQR